MEVFCKNPFWDPDLLNSSTPDVSECFQETVLAWIPCFYLFLVSPLYFYCLKKNNKGYIKLSLLHVLKSVTCAILILLTLIDLLKGVSDYADENVTPVYIFTPALLCVTMICAFVVIQDERMKGQMSSGVMFVFWILAVGCGVIEFRSKIIQDTGDTFRYVTFYMYYVFLIVSLVLSAFSDHLPHYSPVSPDTNPCPEKTASFLSRITFWWFTSLAIQGYKRALVRADLWSLLKRDEAGTIVPRFLRKWRNEICRTVKKRKSKETRERKKFVVVKLDEDPHLNAKSGGAMSTKTEVADDSYAECHELTDFFGRPVDHKASLLKSLVKAFGGWFLLGAVYKFIYDILLFVSPQILRLLIIYTLDKSIYEWQGYVYAISLLIVGIVQSLFLHQYFHICFVTGMHLRTAIIGAVYRKSLVLSNSARKTATVGEIVNLMSVDAQRFMDLMTYLNSIWSSPLQIIVSLYFLWGVLGPSVLAGVGIMVLLVPLNAFIATKSKKLQVKQMALKDARIKLTNEVLSGIKVLKLYAWEESFEDKIKDLRNKELVYLKKFAYLNAGTTFTWTCAPFLVSLCTFAVYVLVDDTHVLDAKKAFVSLSLFNILRFPLIMFPNIISNIVQSSVSLRRLERFLKQDELDLNSVEHCDMPGQAVVVDNATFSWGKDDDPNLQDINLDVQEGAIIAVVGKVGSGKSSLISAMLGEMEKTKGKVFTKGSTAYVSQQAWIQNATLRDNILFGRNLEEVKYHRIVQGCALATDFDMLPGGDMTEIGEKGINLSGGQKQRVSLARAVYSNANIYYLDDPLSAVDSHVGKHIFDHVIGPDGLLKNKTRILVTHGISFLPQVDQIVVLVDGQVSEVGSYTELLEQEGAFSEFLKNYSLDAEKENGTEDQPTVLSLHSEGLEVVKGRSDEDERCLSMLSVGDECGKSSDNIDRRLTYDTVSQLDSISIGRQIPLAKYKKMEELKKVAMDNKEEKLIEKEKTETGKVKWSVYTTYLKSVGWPLSILILIFYLLSNAASIGANLWLSHWSDQPVIDGVNDASKRDMYLGVYGALGFAQGLGILFGGIWFVIGGLMASKKLHKQMVHNILLTPMSFFDKTPKGRLLNRFSKDIDNADFQLPQTFQSWLGCVFKVSGALIVICISTPVFLTVFPALALFYYIVQVQLASTPAMATRPQHLHSRFYVCTSRQLKRLESVSRSPIYSHFSETITGTSTIRAYGRQSEFIQQNQGLIDENQVTYYPNACSNRWLALRLEFVGNLIVFFASLFAVIGRDNLSPGLVGLSVSYAMQITQTLNWLVRMTSDLETNIVAVERIKEYSETSTEAARIVEDNRPDEGWPSKGEIVMTNYSTRYREGLDLVVKGIDISIKSGEKIGIVGRTGAGKSSLTLAIFRIIEAAGGTITIDGIDISKIGLQDLRSKVTIIPQDPVLFAGSLRMNLDPFDSYTDDEIWNSLSLSHLQVFVSSLPRGLQHECTEGGENLSVGQRQLICLARALLRKSKLLVLDEATAAVDLETDDLIQATIRMEFADCTVLTIAHRLNTIMDSSRILVLDDGRVSQFASPTDLLSIDGIFFNMAKDAGLV
ncbi:multidrug resistance-associated protein 1-like isoform X2 [Anneissia japonica]|uniref:multidrug resistance-associated protein 1-like isoform X2 n=1 Tax=Anneissia japonica TaxID=1529436 RepID=UPI0014259D55|nr:multidrug resistance-associated protein 1-like isoform X2 [Anneissia japonica]